MATSQQIAEDAAAMIAEQGGFAVFLERTILGGIAYAFGLQAISGITSIGGLVLAPVRALGRGMVRLVDGTINNVILVFDAGTQTTILSFTDGVARWLGPFAQPASVGVGMLSVAVFIWTINRFEISPMSFLQSVRG